MLRQERFDPVLQHVGQRAARAIVSLRPALVAIARTAIVMALALGSGGCDGDVGDAAGTLHRVRESAIAPRTLVLVTIDTLRADHVGAYGYWRHTTPFLDRLASEGIRFERAFAQSGTTQPSHASMFTGLYPLQHRVVRNGRVLASEHVTLAEALQTAGYTAAAFTSTNAHFQWGGLTQGFDLYDEQPVTRRGEPLYRPASQTVEATLAWLRRHRPGDRLFLWVHLFDPHRPFAPPAEYLRSTWPQDAVARRNLAKRLGDEHRLVVRPNGALLRQIAYYDAEIRYADAELRRLFDALEDLGRARDAVWILTSDHGQGLGNHGWFGHSKQIYNAQLHVPLIVWDSAGRLGVGVTVSQVVEHVDLAPTLLSIAGLDPEEHLPETAVGQSLLPLLGAPGTYDKAYAFAQRSAYPATRQQRNVRLVPGSNYALQDRDFKYLLYEEADDELYLIGVDPYESRNVLEENAEVAARMRGRLQALIDGLDAGGAADDVPEDVLERLRSLGYVQ